MGVGGGGAGQVEWVVATGRTMAHSSFVRTGSSLSVFALHFSVGPHVLGVGASTRRLASTVSWPFADTKTEATPSLAYGHLCSAAGYVAPCVRPGASESYKVCSTPTSTCRSIFPGR